MDETTVTWAGYDFLKEKILGLIDRSLKEKWYEGSSVQVRHNCSFCKDVGKKSCDICLCLPFICGPLRIDKNDRDLISQLSGIEIRYLEPDQLMSIIQAFADFRQGIEEETL